jgi:hypothetical protein
VEYEEGIFAIFKTMAESLPAADILWWDSKDIRVQCPFCKEGHRHGFDGSYTGVTRGANCDPAVVSSRRHQYRICFPFDAASNRIAYEIDKAKQRFITISITQEQVEIDLAESLQSTLHIDEDTQKERIKFEDASETVTIPLQAYGRDDLYERKEIDCAISKCILGNVPYVKEYLNTTNEPHIFIHGVDQYGDTTLISAAAERTPSMVTLLLESGSEVNAINDRGRSPLMEAALWGRIDNVELLLQHGAKKDLRDRAGCLAIDLALPNDKNAKERFTRSGGRHQVYKEDTFTANRHREQIVQMLEEKPKQSATPFGPKTSKEPTFELYSFYKSPLTSSITLVAPVADFPVPYQSKTIARLERGSPFPAVDAMSGWGHKGEELITVAGNVWTEEVFRISKAVGHTLSEDSQKDQGRPGLFQACHAEKQLITYFIGKHAFLPEEVGYVDQEIRRIHQAMRDSQYSNCPQPSEDDWKLIEKEQAEREEWPLRELFLNAPSVYLKNSTIIVSSRICSNCALFKDLVNSHLGLSITLLSNTDGKSTSS